MYTYSPCSKPSTYQANYRAPVMYPGGMMPMHPTHPVHPAAMPMQYPSYPQQPMAPTTDTSDAMGGGEESYIENILRFNRGKIATLYLTYENNTQWNAKIVRGRIETAGRDFIIVSDPQSGRRYILQMVNLDWVEFDGPIAYIPPKVSPTVAKELTTGER